MSADFDKIDLEENPALKERVVKDTELKEWLPSSVGRGEFHPRISPSA